MSVQKRVDELSPYVDAISFGKTPVVQTILPSKWVVYDNDNISAKPLEALSDSRVPYVFYSEKVTVDDILDYIEVIISINKEREEKMKLLKIKVDELKKIFTDSSLIKLKTLRFVMDEEEGVTDEDLELPITNETVVEEVIEELKPVEVIKSYEPEPMQVQPTHMIDNTPIDPKAKPVLEDFAPARCNCTGGQVCPECVDY
jgi:hypothetical protein